MLFALLLGDQPTNLHRIDYIAIMLRATQELKELIMDDPPLDPPATQQNPPLIESGTASQTFESLSADAGDMNDEMRQEFTEVFELFDKDGSGRLRVTDLNTIMRSLGQNPTEMEMTDVMSKADLTEDGQFTVEGKSVISTFEPVSFYPT